MNYPIDVDSGGYRSACSDFYDADHEIVTAVNTLTSAIYGSSGMAGTDTGGEAWAAQYDPAATDLVEAMCSMSTSLASMANLLNSSLANHSGADNSELFPGPPSMSPGGSDSDPNHYGETISAPAPPSAKGGTGGQPDWWHWIAGHVGGLLWPDADTGRLKSAGAAWKAAGSTITSTASSVSAAKAMVGTQKSPEVADATAACSEIEGHLEDLGTYCTTVGQACEDYAKHVEDAHQEIEDELSSFIEWTIAIEVGGGVLAVFTLGISEAAAQAAEAAEVANAATKVIRLLNTLIEAARTVATTISTVLGRIATTVGKLGKFLNPRLEKALVETGEKLGLDALDGEEKAAYDKYVARKAKEGTSPKGPEEWKRLKDQLALNKANGDAFEAEMMEADGITPGQGGWSSQVNYEAKDGLRRFDYANETDKVAVEVKSGSTPTKEGLVQLDKDEEALRDGWDVTWHLKKDLSPSMMARLEELSSKYPTFHYDIGG